MKNELTIFENEEFGEVRTIIKNGEFLFCLGDLCRALDLTAKGVKQRLRDEVISNYPIEDSLGRMQSTIFVNEDGMYDVVLESRKKNARKFRKWITGVVLPSIRKTGSYSVHKESAPDYSDTAPKGLLWFLQLDSKDRMDALAFMQTASSYMTSVQKEAGAYNPEVKATSSQPTVSAASDFKAKAMEQAKLVCKKQNLGKQYKKGLSAIYKEMTKHGVDWGEVKHEYKQAGGTDAAPSCLEQITQLPKYQNSFFEAATCLQ